MTKKVNYIKFHFSNIIKCNKTYKFLKTGWYHTGDLGKYTENGEIFVLGRISDIIKYKNYTILPSEIEATLESHPDVEQAAVVSIPHEPDGEWPVAFVKKVPGSNVSQLVSNCTQMKLSKVYRIIKSFFRCLKAI